MDSKQYRVRFEHRKLKYSGEHKQNYNRHDGHLAVNFYIDTYGSMFKFWLSPPVTGESVFL